MQRHWLISNPSMSTIDGILDCHHRRCFARLFARYHRARNLLDVSISHGSPYTSGTMARLDRHMKPANRTRTSGLPRLGKGASGKYLFKGHGGDRLAMPRLDPNATKRDVTGQHYRPGLTTANQIDSHATTLNVGRLNDGAE